MKPMTAKILSTSLLIAMTASAEVAPFGVFIDGNLSRTRPAGWIADWLNRQRDGLTGHPEALSYPYDSCLWAGTIERQGDHGSAWWRYEQTAYYTDGLLRLGLALDDAKLIAKATEGIDYTLAHASPEGYLGNPCMWDAKNFETSPGKETWPMTVFFRAMKAAFDASGDPRIPLALAKYYALYDAASIARERNLIAIEGVLWTYSKTGDAKLLALAEEAWKLAPEAENWPRTLTSRYTDGEDPVFLHGVTTSEELKIPVLLAEYTGKTNYLASALNAMRKTERDHLLPDGCISSTEQTRGNSVHWGHETCNVTDFSWSLGYFLEATGDAKYGDMIERCVFNAGFGSVTKDFKSLQYFSNLNQFIATSESDHNPFKYGSTWMQYRPTHETECCAGNVSRFLPNYVSRMWLTDKNGDPVAALHGPSSVSFPWGVITAETRYPYDGKIRYVFKMTQPKRMNFRFRVPGWVERGAATVALNGHPANLMMNPASFASFGEREYRDGDVVEVELPMSVRCERLPRRKYVVRDFFGNLMSMYGTDGSQGRVVARGPLLYAYPIPTEQTEDTVEHANMNGKKSANPEFKSWTMKPAGPFNYALAADDPAGSFVVASDGSSIEVPVKRIRWDLDEGCFTPDIPVRPEVIADEVERIRLVPYGLTCLRLTVFPNR